MFFVTIALSSGMGVWPPLIAMLGAAGGVFLFLSGFRMLRYKRLILNTPFSKIRSASIGLVEVNGMPVGPRTLTAPITGAPCFYYRARAWQWKESGKDSKWDLVVDESMFVPFFLEDSTGNVLVNSQGADLDVHRSFKEEVSASFFRKGGPVPQSVQDFVISRGIIPTDKIRLEEQIIPPSYPLFVFGTLGENRLVDSWTPQAHANHSGLSFDFDAQGPLNVKMTYSFSGNGAIGKAIQSWIGAGVPRAVTNPWGIDVSNGNRLLVVPLGLGRASGIGGNVDALSALSAGQSGDGKASPAAQNLLEMARQRLQAQVSAALQSQAATTSGQVSDKEFDLRGHVAIGKGERNEPFTISSHSQREVVQALAWKSVALIWGGPLLALACGYFLWIYFTW